MSTPEPGTEALALCTSAKIAAQAMGLAGIYRSNSPAGCAESRSEVFAALIQAHALHRLVDAMEPLERIACAMEAMAGTGGRPAEPAVAIGVPSAENGETEAEEKILHAIAHAFPFEDSDANIAKILAAGLNALPETKTLRKSRDWLPDWTTNAVGICLGAIARACEEAAEQAPVSPGDPAPSRPTWQEPDPPEVFTSDSSPPSPPAVTEPAPVTPGGHPLDQGGWIRSRVPTEGDGDEDGCVKAVYLPYSTYFWCHWSLITPGQPWAPPKSDPELLPIP